MPSKIVDGHIHFWDPDQIKLDWTKGKPVLERAYRPSDLFEEAGEDIIVDRIVMIQVASTKEDGIIEARWVNSLAEQIPQVQGIVAFAPLETPDSARESLDIFGDIPRIKGIRRNIQDEALGFARQPAFVRGVQILSRLWLFLRHLHLSSSDS